MKRKMDVLVDLQFGSTGKGALAGYLSEKEDYDVVVSANLPNAGHTAYCPLTGEKFVHKVLPSGIFGESLEVIGVGPGGAFFLDRLEEEWKNVCDYMPDSTLLIHEAAVVCQPQHKLAEQVSLSRISSTMQGSAEAVISKIRREEGATAMYHMEDIHRRLDKYGEVMVVPQSEWLNIMNGAERILLEGSQGYSLSTSAGFYPYCTSRDCTPARVVADCSLPMGWVREVFGSARVHPIRVGNTPDGYSGDWYPDQEELSFERLGVDPERTTVTQRVRRIATFSGIQIREAMAMALPNHVFLNFYQYDPAASEKALDTINMAAEKLGCGGVSFIGTGPLPSNIIEVME